MSSFDAVSQQSNQIFMAHVTNSFNLHTKFLLCLAPRKWAKIRYIHPDKMQQRKRKEYYVLKLLKLTDC